jgi:Flp pilus assembly protein TadD
VRLKPDYPEARNNLGVALYQRGLLAEAAEHIGEAVRLKPDYADATRNLGMVKALLEKAH